MSLSTLFDIWFDPHYNRFVPLIPLPSDLDFNDWYFALFSFYILFHSHLFVFLPLSFHILQISDTSFWLPNHDWSILSSFWVLESWLSYIRYTVTHRKFILLLYALKKIAYHHSAPQCVTNHFIPLSNQLLSECLFIFPLWYSPFF